ncbi:MAG: YlbF family regulator [Halanaerobiales bacterium]|nr:YlbF family regulator [Halanaerobiales bacterium]
MSVHDTARRLQRKLKNSDEYQKYQELRKKVLEKEGSKKMLLDYQNLMMEMQSKRMSGEELSEEDKERLQNLQNFIEINNNVKKYLEAEYALSQTIQDIQKIIFSDIKVGIPEEELQPETEDSGAAGSEEYSEAAEAEDSKK